MALINPSNLYSAGNVVLDSSPYMRIALQQRARKQAMEEAANQYFSKLPEKLNTAGVRAQDMEDPNGHGGIQNDIDKWQENWYRNKAEILRGGMAHQKQMADFQKIRQRIAESKNRAKNELMIGKEVLKPNGWKPRESDHPIIESMSRSIYDPSSKKDDGVSEYSLSDLSLSAAPYDAIKQQQFDKAILNGITPVRDETSYTLDKDGQKVLYTQKYRPQDILNAAQKAAQLTASDRTMKYKYEDLLHDADAVKTASDALTKLAGVPVVAETPEQLAAGLKAHELSSFAKQAEEKDVAAANRFKQKLQDERLAAAANRQRIAEAGKNARVNKLMGDVNVDYPLNVLVENYGVDKELKSAEGNSYGTVKKVKETDIPIGQLDLYNKKDKYGRREVNAVLDPETNERYYYAIKNADGNWELVGDENKKIGADDTRELKINKTIPANKEKRKMLLNKPGTTKPKKDPLGLF